MSLWGQGCGHVYIYIYIHIYIHTWPHPCPHNDMRTRREMMTSHDMMTVIVSTMTVPEIFLYLCGCVALLRQGRGPRRSVHLCSRRSTLPRNLHMNPARLPYDPAPHRADHLLSRRFNSPRKLHYVAFTSRGGCSRCSTLRPR